MKPSLTAAMTATLDTAIAFVREGLVELGPTTIATEVGVVTRVADGVAAVGGLTQAVAGELMEVEGVLALAMEVAEHEVRLVLLEAGAKVHAGSLVRPLHRVAEVPVGPELIGRVVNPLGAPLDGRVRLAGSQHRARVDPRPVELAHREPVSRPLTCGVFAVDTMIPIGRGQRQLVIGDRSTGKTELCLDILVGVPADTVPVYVAIGRRGSEIAGVLQWLRERDVLSRGFAVLTCADDPPGLIHLAPYAACAMAEALMAEGRDVVIVYDDLTHHAHVHRTLALLLGRPVGREAHPVDVFYAHARLLERATQLGQDWGGGSLTAFPIVETQAGDLTGYIPTNLVSITDGQIRLDAALVAAGQIPAVDVGLSVSRVGGKAQPPLVRRLAGAFKNRYAQFLELESFARFGTRLEQHAQAEVDWGRRVRGILRQPRGEPVSPEQTVALLLLTQTTALSQVDEGHLEAFVAPSVRAIVTAIAAAGMPTDPHLLAALAEAGARAGLEAAMGLSEAPNAGAAAGFAAQAPGLAP